MCSAKTIPALAGMLLLAAQAAHPASYYWRGDLYNSGTHDFSTAGNWSGAAPGAVDYAYFSGAGSYPIPQDSDFTVQFSASLTNNRAFWQDGRFNITLDLNGRSYAVTALCYVGVNAADDITLTLTNGTAYLAGWAIGRNADTTGRLVLRNGASMRPLSSGSIGYNGTGTLDVVDGNIVSTADIFYAGNQPGSHGIVNVSGAGSFISNGNHIYFGSQGNATLTIDHGGRIIINTANHYILFANNGGAGQVATALITGANSLLRNKVTTVGRGIGLGGMESTWGGGQAHVTVSDQARMESNRDIWLWQDSSLTVDNGNVEAGNNFYAYDGSQLAFVLHGTNAIAPVVAANDIQIGNAVELKISLAGATAFNLGDFISLMQYGNACTGTFKDLPEGAQIAASGYRFAIAYAGGAGGKTIGLTVTRLPPPPGTMIKIR